MNPKLALARSKAFKDSLFLLADQAYASTLKVYHGWVVKGIFAVSFNASSGFATGRC